MFMRIDKLLTDIPMPKGQDQNAGSALQELWRLSRIIITMTLGEGGAPPRTVVLARHQRRRGSLLVLTNQAGQNDW